MKIIKIQESQLRKIVEGEINPSIVKEYPGSEVSTTTNVTDTNGEITFGEQPTTDDFANQQTPQSFFARGLKNARFNNTI